MQQPLTLAPSRCKRQWLWAGYGLVMVCLSLWSWQWSQLGWQLPVAMVVVYPFVKALNTHEVPVSLHWADGHWQASDGWQLSTQSRVGATCMLAVWHRQGQRRYEVLFDDQCNTSHWRAFCRQLRVAQWQHH